MASFVGSSTAGGNLATISPAWPAGIVSGDVAIVVWGYQSTFTATAPTGFTLLNTVNSNSGSLTSAVYYKVCTGSETGSLSITASGANRQSVVLAVFRGIDTSNPIGTSAIFNETVAGTTHAAPSITTVSVDPVVLTTYQERATTGTNDAVPGSGYTDRGDTLALATGSGGSIAAIAQENPLISRASGASVTPPSWTSGNGFSTANVVTRTITLKTLSNLPPAANAGVDQIVEPWSTVTLTGTDSDSDGTVSTRSWTQTGGTPVATLAGSGATVTFEAPATIAGTTLTFMYSVIDNGGLNASDTMTVTILPVTERAVVGGVEVPMRII